MLQVKIRILGIDDEDAEQNAKQEDEFARVERLADKLIKEMIEDLNKVRKSSINKTQPQPAS